VVPNCEFNHKYGSFMLTTRLLMTWERDDHGITIYLMYFLFCFRLRTLEQSTTWKICEGVGGRWANLRGGKGLRRTPRGFMQLERACIHNHTIYSLRPILTFINTNVSRYILVLDTSIFMKGNIRMYECVIEPRYAVVLINFLYLSFKSIKFCSG
jgi:hypothetical protein